MQAIRYPIQGPTVYGPTGPQLTSVMNVPAGGTHISLDDPAFANLRDLAQKQVPYMLAADGSNVAYAWALVGSGLSADPTATVFGPTAVNQCGVIYANQRLDQPEMAPQGAKGFVARSYSGAGTGTLRIWRIG